MSHARPGVPLPAQLLGMTERAFPSHGGLSRGWTLAHDSRVSGTLGVRLPAPHPSSPARPSAWN